MTTEQDTEPRMRAVQPHAPSVEWYTLVSEARPAIELLSRYSLTATWAQEWLERANELLGREKAQ